MGTALMYAKNSLAHGDPAVGAAELWVAFRVLARCTTVSVRSCRVFAASPSKQASKQKAYIRSCHRKKKCHSRTERNGSGF